MTINHYGKSYTDFRVLQKSMALNDLERQFTALPIKRTLFEFRCKTYHAKTDKTLRYFYVNTA